MTPTGNRDPPMSRLSTRRLKEIRSLTQKKYRERRAETLVEGLRGVEAALDAGAQVREVLVTETVRCDRRLAPRLDALGDRVYVVSTSELEAVSAVETSQGVLAVVAIDQVPPDALSSMTRLLMLDGLGDPGNAGTLIRTAAWFGVDAVVTVPGTVDLYNPKVVRSAMGGLWDLHHVVVADAAETLRGLRAGGCAVYGADLEGTPVARWTPATPSILVLGSEAHGISDAARSEIDECIHIRGRSRLGGTESLNVAVAAGILMYEWTRNS